MANGYSSESTRRELSNEYQHDRVWMVFEILCVLVLWMNIALALEGFYNLLESEVVGYHTVYLKCLHLTAFKLLSMRGD